MQFPLPRDQETTALTPAPRIPKMALQTESNIEAAMFPSHNRGSSNVFRAILTDLHFWIPLSVLAGGFFLLDKLR